MISMSVHQMEAKAPVVTSVGTQLGRSIVNALQVIICTPISITVWHTIVVILPLYLVHVHQIPTRTIFRMYASK